MSLEALILGELAKKSEPQTAAQVYEAIANRSDTPEPNFISELIGKTSLASVFTALNRMETQGFVEVKEIIVDGNARRAFEINERGRGERINMAAESQTNTGSLGGKVAPESSRTR